MVVANKSLSVSDSVPLKLSSTASGGWSTLPTRAASEKELIHDNAKVDNVGNVDK